MSFLDVIYTFPSKSMSRRDWKTFRYPDTSFQEARITYYHISSFSALPQHKAIKKERERKRRKEREEEMKWGGKKGRGTYLITEMILNSCPPPGSAVASSNSHRRICSPGVKSVRIVIPLFISHHLHPNLLVFSYPRSTTARRSVPHQKMGGRRIKTGEEEDVPSNIYNLFPIPNNSNPHPFIIINPTFHAP